jgi:aspartyl protease family protein
MDGGEFGQLIYLSLLAAAIGGYFIVENRHRMGKVAQQAAIWALIFVGAIAVVGLWGDVSRNVSGRAAVMADGSVELPRAPDGHFYASALINGERVQFVVDTGASDIVLTQEDAARIGLDPASLSYIGSAYTANGPVDTAPVTLASFDFAGFSDVGVEAVVNAGDLDMSLLGMSYLKAFHITIDGEVMTLRR